MEILVIRHYVKATSAFALGSQCCSFPFYLFQQLAFISLALLSSEKRIEFSLSIIYAHGIQF